MIDRLESVLIAKCRCGDRAAICELFQRNYPSSLHLARGILRSEADSEDAVQSAFISAFIHLDCFRGESSFKTWVTRIVRNQCLMALREPRRKRGWISLDDRHQDVPVVIASSDPNPEKSTLGWELASALAEALAGLPRRMREILVLCEVSEITAKEAAAILGITLAAAKSRLLRAKVRMRSRLQLYAERLPAAAPKRNAVQFQGQSLRSDPGMHMGTVVYDPGVLARACSDPLVSLV